MQQYPYVTTGNPLGSHSPCPAQNFQVGNYTAPITSSHYHYQSSNPYIVSPPARHEFPTGYRLPAQENAILASTHQNIPPLVAHGSIHSDLVAQSGRKALEPISQDLQQQQQQQQQQQPQQQQQQQQHQNQQQAISGLQAGVPIRMNNPYHNVTRQMENMKVNDYDRPAYNMNAPSAQRREPEYLASLPSVAVVSPQESGGPFVYTQDPNMRTYTSNAYSNVPVNSFQIVPPSSGLPPQSAPYPQPSEVRYPPPSSYYNSYSGMPNSNPGMRDNCLSSDSRYSSADSSTTWTTPSQSLPPSQLQGQSHGPGQSPQTETPDKNQNSIYQNSSNPNTYIPTQNYPIKQQGVIGSTGYPLAPQNFLQSTPQHKASMEQINSSSQYQSSGSDPVSPNFLRNETYVSPDGQLLGRQPLDSSVYRNGIPNPGQRDVRLQSPNQLPSLNTRPQFQHQNSQNQVPQYQYQPPSSIYSISNSQSLGYTNPAQANYSAPPNVQYPALYANEMHRDQGKINMGNMSQFNQVSASQSQRPPFQVQGLAPVNENSRFVAPTGPLQQQYQGPNSSFSQRYPGPEAYSRDISLGNQGNLTPQLVVAQQISDNNRRNSFQSQNGRNPAALIRRGSQEDNQSQQSIQRTYPMAPQVSIVNQGQTQTSQPYPTALPSVVNPHGTVNNPSPTYHSKSSVDGIPAAHMDPKYSPYNSPQRFATGPSPYPHIQQPEFDRRNSAGPEPQNVASLPNDRLRPSDDNQPGRGFSYYAGGAGHSHMPNQIPNTSFPTYPKDPARVREFQHQENRIPNTSHHGVSMPGQSTQPIVIMPGRHGDHYPASYSAHQHSQEVAFESKIESILARLHPQLHQGIEFTKLRKAAEDIRNLEDDILKFSGRRGKYLVLRWYSFYIKCSYSFKTRSQKSLTSLL